MRVSVFGGRARLTWHRESFPAQSFLDSSGATNGSLSLLVINPNALFRRILRHPINDRSDLASILPSYVPFEPEECRFALGRDPQGHRCLAALSRSDNTVVNHVLERSELALVAPAEFVLEAVMDRIRRGRLYDLHADAPRLLPLGTIQTTVLTSLTVIVAITLLVGLGSYRDRQTAVLSAEWREVTQAAAPLAQHMQTSYDLLSLVAAVARLPQSDGLHGLANVLAWLGAEDYLRAARISEEEIELVVMTPNPDRLIEKADFALVSSEVVDFPKNAELTLVVSVDRLPMQNR